MSAFLWTQSFRVADNTAFRGFITSFRNMMSTLGWVRLTEGSPADVTTILKPTTGNTQIGATTGKDIFRMDDALQATKPVHLEVQYWTNGYNPNNATNDSTHIKLVFRVGLEGTDGSLNLITTNNKVSIARSIEFIGHNATTSNVNGISATDADGLTQHQVSGGNNRLSLYWGANGLTNIGTTGDTATITSNAATIANNLTIASGVAAIYDYVNWMSGILNIERTKDKDGNDTGDGVHIHHLNLAYLASGTTVTWFAPNSHLVQPQNIVTPQRYFEQTLVYEVGKHSLPQFGWDCVDWSPRHSMVLNDKKYVIPIYPNLGGQKYNPIVGLVGAYDFDYELGINSNINIYGTARQYRKTPQLHKCILGRNWEHSRVLIAEF